MMGGGLGATVVSYQRHQFKGRKNIDYELILLTLPMLMSGCLFGVSQPNLDNTQPFLVLRDKDTHIRPPNDLRYPSFLQGNHPTKRLIQCNGNKPSEDGIIRTTIRFQRQKQTARDHGPIRSSNPSRKAQNTTPYLRLHYFASATQRQPRL